MACPACRIDHLDASFREKHRLELLPRLQIAGSFDHARLADRPHDLQTPSVLACDARREMNRLGRACNAGMKRCDLGNLAVERNLSAEISDTGDILRRLEPLPLQVATRQSIDKPPLPGIFTAMPGAGQRLEILWEAAACRVVPRAPRHQRHVLAVRERRESFR